MKTFIKQIKTADSKKALDSIILEAFYSPNINESQYDKLLSYTTCREIELGIWDYINHYPNKESALEEVQKEFKIKY